MKEWEFEELHEYIEEVFDKSLKDGLTALEAGGRCLYEFANVIEEGEAEREIFYVTLALLQIKKGGISRHILEEVTKIVDTFNASKLESELEKEDITKFVKFVDELRVTIPKFNSNAEKEQKEPSKTGELYKGNFLKQFERKNK
jgi:hypothetical protein